MKILRYIPLLLIVISVAIALSYYSRLPDEMASHWNAKGEVDSTAPKFWVLFLIPVVMSALWGVFAVIPRIDPLKANIAEFRPFYDGFVIVIFLFTIFVQLHLILWSLGTKVAPMRLIPFGMGLVFYYAGILCSHAKRNWFVGVRTPWSLSSDNVWRKTNKLGGMLFKLSGIIALFGVMFPDAALYLLGIPALITMVIVVVYSYVEFRKEHGDPDLPG